MLIEQLWKAVLLGKVSQYSNAGLGKVDQYSNAD